MALKDNYTSEPGINSFRVLESDIYGDDEYYIYFDQLTNIEYVRKKIGGWINISKFYPLLNQKGFDTKGLDSKLIKNVKRTKKLSVSSSRYNGLWIPLKDARTFAELYHIKDIANPILDFERIALTSYSGKTFWEYFASTQVDLSIRILRDSKSNRVNLKQIFTLYDKLKGKDAKAPLQERNFYSILRSSNSSNISEKNDPTLCGGFWVDYDIVKQYCKKHKLYKAAKPILNFQSSPDQAGSVRLDNLTSNQRRYWRSSASDTEFFGYPKSFSGGKAPSFPEKLKQQPDKKIGCFKVEELVERKKVCSDVTEQHNSVFHSIYLRKRYSDGWINGSTLVKAACILKVKQLDYGKDDPVMVTLNELYYRDVLQTYDCEPVASSRASTLNGLWISGKDARILYKSISIEENSISKSVEDFLNDSTYENDADEEEDDDDIDVLNEDQFNEQTNNSNAESIDRNSSDEEDAAYNSDKPINEVHEIIGIDENSNYNNLFDEPYDNEIKQEFLEGLPSEDYTQTKNDQEKQQPKPQHQKSQQHQQHQQQLQNKEHQQKLQQLGDDNQSKNKANQEFKDVKKQLEIFLSSPSTPTAAEDRRIKAVFTILENQKGINPKMVEASGLGSTLSIFRKRFNLYHERIEAILKNWRNQNTNQLPSESFSTPFSRRDNNRRVIPSEYRSRHSDHGNNSSHQYNSKKRTNSSKNFPETPSAPYGSYASSNITTPTSSNNEYRTNEQHSANPQQQFQYKSPQSQLKYQPQKSPYQLQYQFSSPQSSSHQQAHYQSPSFGKTGTSPISRQQRGSPDNRSSVPKTPTLLNHPEYGKNGNQNKKRRERFDELLQSPFNPSYRKAGYKEPDHKENFQEKPKYLPNFRTYKPPVNTKFDYEIQKLINEDDLIYTHLKLTLNDREECKREIVEISSGDQLTDVIFNNESVRKFRKLAHFEPILQRREQLLKRRKSLSAGLVNQDEDKDNNKIDFPKRLTAMIAEKQIRKGI